MLGRAASLTLYRAAIRQAVIYSVRPYHPYLTNRQMASTSAVSSSSKQPPWTVPRAAPGYEEPKLKVYNSLTRSKVDFVPIKGRHVTWYNCGPTVYDSSHMGHARNYVTQDIIRRILRDYFGYDIHFVMNITDIDDKIIVRARQSHLLSQFRSEEEQKGLSKSLVDLVRTSWSAYFQKTLKKLAPKPPPGEPREPEDEAAWEELSRREQQDAKWVQSLSETEPKFRMWFNALRTSREAIIAAAMAQAAGDKGSEAAVALIDASGDILSSYLDGQSGHTVSDPAVFRRLAAYWEEEFFKDMKRLHVERPTTLTRVSEYVPEIVTFVEKIISNGFAYEDSGPGDGKKNVWFDTRAFDGAEEGETKHSYAKLAPWSKGNSELLEEGEGSLSTGASTVAGKRAASDFALWKSSKPGEPAWESPWGPGRPGWHIECSVMASEVLGTRIDVHSGGVDLMFPHHDNELAQAEAHHHCNQWINYFLHTGHLHIEGQKMSKSLKNFISIDEALQKYSARQLRLAFLLQPWNSRMDFKQSAMAEVRNAENSFNNFFASVRAIVREAKVKGRSFSDGQHHYGQGEKELMSDLASTQMTFRKAMCDSFDTPTGFTALLELVSKTNVYERSRDRTNVNVSVLEAVAKYVGDMLRMLGLGEGVVREGDVGWGEVIQEGKATDMNREEVLMPYLRALSSFRDSIRAAGKRAQNSEILQLSDQFRDFDMVDLGVALEDQKDDKALVKFADPSVLRLQRDEKERLMAEKAIRKAEMAAKAEADEREKLERGKTEPKDLFQTIDFTAWDDKGLPTKDKDGNDVSKSKRKQCEKEYEKQKRLHEYYLIKTRQS